MKTETTKSTILIISMGFLILFFIAGCKWAGYTSLIVGVTGILSDFLSKKIEWAWMKLAKLLSFIVPNILLTVVFLFILFPISLLSKIFSKDPLMLAGKYKSYFIDVNREMSKKNFEEIW